MASGEEKRCTVGASPSDAFERVRRVEVPASSPSKVAQAWKKQYARNVHAGLCDAYLNRRLSDLALLEAPYRAVARALRDASQLVDTWVADTQQLTGVFWPQLGTWRSGAFVDEVLGWLRTRIDELLEMRAVVHQLSAVLSPSKLAELKVAKVARPLRACSRSTTPSSPSPRGRPRPPRLKSR